MVGERFISLILDLLTKTLRLHDPLLFYFIYHTDFIIERVYLSAFLVLHDHHGLLNFGLASVLPFSESSLLHLYVKAQETSVPVLLCAHVTVLIAAPSVENLFNSTFLKGSLVVCNSLSIKVYLPKMLGSSLIQFKSLFKHSYFKPFYDSCSSIFKHIFLAAEVFPSSHGLVRESAEPSVDNSTQLTVLCLDFLVPFFIVVGRLLSYRGLKFFLIGLLH